jgi:hypothetical protein
MSDPFLGYESRTSESHKSMFVQKVLHMTKAISPCFNKNLKCGALKIWFRSLLLPKMNLKIISCKIIWNLHYLCIKFFSAPLPCCTEFTMIWCVSTNTVTSRIIMSDLYTILFIKCCNFNHQSSRTKHSLLKKSRRRKIEILLSKIIFKIKRQHCKL